MQTFYQYTTGIVLLSVAVSVSIYRDMCRIACIAVSIVSDDNRIIPAIMISRSSFVWILNSLYTVKGKGILYTLQIVTTQMTVVRQGLTVC